MKKYRLPQIFLLSSILIATGCELYVEPYVGYDERDEYIGVYEVEEYSESASATFFYDIVIRKSGSWDRRIWIDNLYDSNISVFARVDGNKFYFPSQRIGDLEIEGRGTLFWGEELSITYSVHERMIGPDYVDDLTCTAWKY